MTITFENPPPRQTGPSGTDPRSIANARTAAILRDLPGEWAIVSVRSTQRRASSYAYSINRGTLHAYLPAGAFEAVARTVDGQHRVYARYVGTPGGAA
jgi:hypothetical protein